MFEKENQEFASPAIETDPPLKLQFKRWLVGSRLQRYFAYLKYINLEKCTHSHKWAQAVRIQTVLVQLHRTTNTPHTNTPQTSAECARTPLTMGGEPKRMFHVEHEERERGREGVSRETRNERTQYFCSEGSNTLRSE